jgi:hypothetical protein
MYAEDETQLVAIEDDLQEAQDKDNYRDIVLIKSLLMGKSHEFAIMRIAEVINSISEVTEPGEGWPDEDPFGGTLH